MISFVKLVTYKAYFFKLQNGNRVLLLSVPDNYGTHLRALLVQHFLWRCQCLTYQHRERREQQWQIGSPAGWSK
jgi:hypothetical protein